jgi:hypothetical protein
VVQSNLVANETVTRIDDTGVRPCRSTALNPDPPRLTGRRGHRLSASTRSKQLEEISVS